MSTHHSFDVELAAELNSVELAILVHHFQHWVNVNKRLKRNFIEGRTWTYQTREEIAAHFPYMNANQVRRLTDKLVDMKILKKGYFGNDPIARTIWYSFENEEMFTIGKFAKCPTQAFGKFAKSSYITDAKTTVVVVAPEEGGAKSEEQQNEPSKQEKSCSLVKSDIYKIGLQKDWKPQEIEVAWKIYENNTYPLSDPIAYIEGIINKKRILKQCKEEKQCSKRQPTKTDTKECSSLSKTDKKPPLEKDTAGHAYQKWNLGNMDRSREISDWMKGKKHFLIFLGNAGIGKTYFCAAIFAYALQKFSSVRYWNESELLKKVRSSMDECKGDYLEALKWLIDDDFVILDDIGSTGLNDWRKEIIFDAIDERYNSMKPTIITSNFSIKEFKECFHERVATRLFSKENCVIEILDGENLREAGK